METPTIWPDDAGVADAADAAEAVESAPAPVGEVLAVFPPPHAVKEQIVANARRDVRILLAFFN